MAYIIEAMSPEARNDVVYQAIAHHTRRQILDLLRAGPQPATEIAGRFSISQPAVSQQLKVLLDASLVKAEWAGRQRIYRIHTARLRPVERWVSRAVAGPSGHVLVFRQAKKGV
jgi:DNA-binding transcriptional ArsR family regulator